VDWELIESNWREFQRNAQSRWRSLSREDLESIAGQRAKLIAKLRERYGFASLPIDEESALHVAKLPGSTLTRSIACSSARRSSTDSPS